jgi:predicted metal-dependent HD superfamily phosphohydrolase
VPGLSTWWALDIRELAPYAQTDTVVAVGADLQRRLGQPHRHYHTATHLVEMFWALEELEQAGEINAREGTLARVAAWFHDAVYDVDDPADNERRSADLALGSLDALGLPAPDMDAVERLILDTAQHLLPQGDALAAAFHDADLWILAAPAERFDAYCAQVRQEYAVVPAEAYAAARAAALEPFTQRDTIYATRTGRQRWEEPAHENLARELHRLRAETPR